MIARALFLRPTRQRPLRFLATVLGVALGVAAIVATRTGSRSAVASLTEEVSFLAGTDWIVVERAGGLDEQVLERLAPFCERFVVLPLIEEVAHLPEIDDVVRFLGVDLLADPSLAQRASGLELATREEGARTFLQLLTRSAALLPRPLASEAGLGLGDSARLLVRGKPLEIEIAGLFDPRGGGGRTLVADLATAQELFERAGLCDRVLLRPRAAIDRERERALLREALPAGCLVRTEPERAAEARGLVRSLSFNLDALSGVAILVGIVLVATTMASSVVERRERIALLRSLGASRAQLALALALECAWIGALGGGLGLALGLLGSRAALAGVEGAFASVVPARPESRLAYDPSQALLAVVLGVAASVLAGLLPLRELLAIPPLQGLRNAPAAAGAARPLRRALASALLLGAALVCVRLPALGGLPVFALLGALALLALVLVLARPTVDALGLRRGGRSFALGGPALRLARAALRSGHDRAAWAAGAVGVAMALAVSMTTMIGSFRTTLVRWNEVALRSDLYVRPLEGATGVAAGTLDPAVAEEARALFGELAVDAFRTASARCRGLAITLAGADFEVAARASSLPFEDGLDARAVFAECLASEACVVNESFARRFGLGRGARITVECGGRSLERRIAGVYANYSSPGGLVVLPRDDFLSLQPDAAPDSLTIHLLDASAPALAAARLKQRLAGRYAVQILTADELHDEVLQVFDRTFAVTAALRLVASAVALLAVLTVLHALVRERRRELAVARALGASRTQIAQIVAYQGSLIATAGTLSGGAVGLAIGWILVRVVNAQSFGWTLRFLPPWTALALTLLAALPAALLASFAPAWRALRTPPAQVLREE